MQFRESHGEKISGESWLMRDIWQITDLPTHGGPIRLASHPQKLTVGAIKNIVYRALRSQQIIKKLDKENGEGNRHDFKMIHGFRKAFKTICENAGMRSINIELLLGHNICVSSSYYKPKQQEVLQDYASKAVNALTINDEFRLKQEIDQIKENDKDRDKQIQELTSQLNFITKQVQEIHHTNTTRKKIDPETIHKLKNGTDADRAEYTIKWLLEVGDKKEKEKQALANILIKRGALKEDEWQKQQKEENNSRAGKHRREGVMKLQEELNYIKSLNK
jgi:hypothetical protein